MLRNSQIYPKGEFYRLFPSSSVQNKVNPSQPLHYISRAGERGRGKIMPAGTSNLNNAFNI